ncbi:DUF6750 family protein [Erwinia papayae]|uniref:DUF6750 family protein n=2 Tax=Erwinia TaxID=551 RepID=A0ABV3N7I1_9GAMM|nr:MULTISPECIES: DUF6750 family protein [Enterobacterales]HCK6787756.1 hypothetical protein [Salmonella enterica subsp. enterica serovar Typhi str. CT18]HEB0918929.1 hypothetical protein [Enterobacter cloacae]MBL0881568.1 hypothetical protein [Serratia ureilytica]MCI3067305.1 hypothetical protein [Escherichia coli]MDC9582071.1 hypothetical protein [Xenorhabdus sp. PR6a]
MMMNTLYKMKIWADNAKYRCLAAMMLMLGHLPGAHAAGWFDTINEIGQGMQAARKPAMLIFGTLGVVAAGMGLIIIKNVNDPKKQQQNHGRGVGSGVIYICVGVALIALAVIIKRTGDTANIQTEI